MKANEMVEAAVEAPRSRPGAIAAAVGVVGEVEVVGMQGQAEMIAAPGVALLKEGEADSQLVLELLQDAVVQAEREAIVELRRSSLLQGEVEVKGGVEAERKTLLKAVEKLAAKAERGSVA